MERRIPLFLVLITGIFGALVFFIPHGTVRAVDATMRNDVLRVIGAFSIVLGIGSILRHHLVKIQRKSEHWPFSWVLIIALIVGAIVGLGGGMDQSSQWGLLPGIPRMPTSIGGFNFDIQTLYKNVMVPLTATMFSMLAFFMASAAYRAFRARSFEATLLLAAAFVLMLGAVPLGRAIHQDLPSFAEWILAVPNTAAKRGILFGVNLGVLATSLKIILGIERGWLGG